VSQKFLQEIKVHFAGTRQHGREGVAQAVERPE